MSTRTMIDADGDTITIEMTTPEPRQIARTFVLAANVIDYVDWNAVAATARQLGGHYEVRFAQDGAATITIFWSYTIDELRDEVSPRRVQE